MRAKEQVQQDIDKYQDWLEIANTEDRKVYCENKIESLKKELADIEKNEAIEADMQRQREEEERINAAVEARLQEKTKIEKPQKDQKISSKNKPKPKFDPSNQELENVDDISQRASENAEKLKRLNQ